MRRSTSKSSIIPISAREASLRRKVRRHLRSLGFHKSDDGALEIDSTDKDLIRRLHAPQRDDRLCSNAHFLSKRAPKLLKYFASGREVTPSAILPRLERVYAGTWQADLFRLAALTWSVPVSNGFGRRLRYVVWDAHNKKLLGLIAIGDPVFNLTVRDKLVGWDVDDRRERLVNVMDAYVLGALPPYNALLGGKMVACLVRSRQIYNQFTRTYGNATGIISGKAKNPRLLVVTTLSSIGRSSVYNRLKLGRLALFRPHRIHPRLGAFFTSPMSSFSSYARTCVSLDTNTPITTDLDRVQTGAFELPALRSRLSVSETTSLRHGIRREVFFCKLASNAATILRTGKGRPNLSSLLTATEVADLALDRWILPRAQRRPDFRAWRRSDVVQLLGNSIKLEPGRTASR